MSVREVFFLGGELCSVQGDGIDAAARACLEGRTRISRVTLPLLDSEISLPYCAIGDGVEAQARLHRVTADALRNAGLSPESRRRTAVFIGTSSGDIGTYERDYAEARRLGTAAVSIAQPWQGDIAERIARRHGLEGPRYSFSTACSAGANALLYAGWMIRHGLIDHALVLGIESYNRMSLLGFSSLLLATKHCCQPFDIDRSGILLGEAVAATVIGVADRSIAGGCGWRLAGGATLCDVGHPTNPAADKIALTLQQALADSAMSAADIVAIKAHGTGTPGNDLAEGLGIREVFATLPPLTSIKPILGHTLGACGVVETLVMQACLDRGAFPGTLGFATPDPQIGLRPIVDSVKIARGPLLLDYFGFGGSNCALVVAPC